MFRHLTQGTELQFIYTISNYFFKKISLGL